MPYPHNLQNRGHNHFLIFLLVLMVCLCKQRILPPADFLFLQERGVLYSYSSHRKAKSFVLRIISSFPSTFSKKQVSHQMTEEEAA